MDTKGFVVPPEKGIMWEMAAGRSAALKMLTRETAGSVMIFEEVAEAFQRHGWEVVGPSPF